MSPDSRETGFLRTMPRSAAGVLSDDSSVLGPLVRRARRLARVDRALRDILDPTLAEHCQVANVERNTLVLQTESSAWASRLRYLAPTLLEKLAARLGWQHVTQTKVLVRPQLPTDRNRPAQPAHMSPESASLLRTVAENTEYPALRQALLRLSRRGS